MLFKTISKSNQAEIVEKSSKFIAFAYSIQSTEELKTKLEELKKIHPKSRHICYAYRLGFDQNNYRMVVFYLAQVVSSKLINQLLNYALKNANN